MAIDLALLVADVARSAFSGVAERYAKHSLEELRANLGEEISEDEALQLLQQESERIQGEAAAWPPERAIKFVPLARGEGTGHGSAGIFDPGQRVTFELLVLNRAELVIHVRDIVGKATAFGHNYKVEYDIRDSNEYALKAREELILVFNASPKASFPSLDQPLNGRLATRFDLTLTATLCGPWQDEGQKTVEVSEQLWLPIFSKVDSKLLLSEADIDLKLEEWIRRTLPRSGTITCDLREIESQAQVPRGTAGNSLRRLVGAITNVDIVVTENVAKATRRMPRPVRTGRRKPWIDR